MIEIIISSCAVAGKNKSESQQFQCVNGAVYQPPVGKKTGGCGFFPAVTAVDFTKCIFLGFGNSKFNPNMCCFSKYIIKLEKYTCSGESMTSPEACL